MKQKGIHHFSGKCVWVIGASSGIGQACATALFAAGAKVAISGRRAEQLKQLANNAPGERVLTLPVDVTNASQITQAHQQILECWGKLDLLLFVSGMYAPMRANELDMTLVEKTINTNLLGPMRAVAAVLPAMLKKHEGHIAIVGSVAGYSGLPKALAYGPSKAGIINFCETLYYDLLPQGVSVHMISPGFVARFKTNINLALDLAMASLIPFTKRCGRTLV